MGRAFHRVCSTVDKRDLFLEPQPAACPQEHRHGLSAEQEFLMEGSRVPSHPREQLPRWRLSQICTKLHNYKAKTYGDFAES